MGRKLSREVPAAAAAVAAAAAARYAWPERNAEVTMRCAAMRLRYVSERVSGCVCVCTCVRACAFVLVSLLVFVCRQAVNPAAISRLECSKGKQ